MKAPFFDTKGKENGSIELQATHFAVAVNTGLLHRLLVLQQANGRIAIAHTKVRGEVNGSTRKLFKQKGTANARVGDRRSPMRRGGGVTFGPRNDRNFTVTMNKKERRLALLSLLSTKAADSTVKVIEEFTLECGRTKNMASVVSAMNVAKGVIAVTREEAARVQGAQNLANIKVINVEYLNPHDLLKYTDLVFTKQSLEHLYSHFHVEAKEVIKAPKKTTRKKKEEATQE